MSQSLFFNKVRGLRHVVLLKKKLGHGCSLMSSAKFLTAPFSPNTSRRLLLTFLILHHQPIWEWLSEDIWWENSTKMFLIFKVFGFFLKNFKNDMNDLFFLLSMFLWEFHTSKSESSREVQKQSFVCILQYRYS